MALRQTIDFHYSLSQLVGLGWAVPDFRTMSRHYKTLTVNVPFREWKDRLLLSIDSTWIKVEGEGE